MSLGNVRGARMKVSMTEQQIAEKAVADYLCNLKAEAATAYAEAWCAAAKEKIMYDAYSNMLKIAAGDSLRLSEGEVNVLAPNEVLISATQIGRASCRERV